MLTPLAYSSQSSRAATAFPTRLWAFIAIGYLAFAIYGSLVPLHFRAMPWEQAVAQFSNIPYLNLGIASRADWVANILLFIPLAFLWNGLLTPRHSVLGGMAISLLIITTCVALSIAIEFTQTFFPPRTVSLNDILAESMGAVIGIMLWWLLGRRFAHWLASWDSTHNDWPGRLLYTYLFGLVVYNLLPLDLTLSPVELFHKWREGRVMLVPFGFHFTNPAQAFYALLSDMAIWVPAGVLSHIHQSRLHRNTHSATRLWLALVVVAIVMEGLQLFVYSRVSDVTDIITAGLGAGLGLWGAPLVTRMDGASGRSRQTTFWQPALWLALGWCGVLMTVFWYPFDFRTDGNFVRERLALLSKVPFETYYYGTEFRAVTEVLHKILFFMPLGAFLALAAKSLRYQRSVAHVVVRVLTFAVLLSAPIAIELGQVMLPGKYPDTTDWLLETIGALLGYALLAWQKSEQKRGATNFQPSAQSVPAPVPAMSAAANSRHAMSWRVHPVTAHAIVYGILLAGLWLVTHSPAAPYNVRELLGGNPLWSALLLSGLLYWTFGAPAWIALRSEAAGLGGWNMLPLLLAHALFAWVLLRSAVPMESIHDIVGSPVLNWPWEWELIGRFLALFSMIALLLIGAAVITMRLCARRADNVAAVNAGSAAPVNNSALMYWFFIATPLLPALLWVVVAAAATDNLTELMRDGGGIAACVWLVIFWLVIAFTGSILSRALAQRGIQPWSQRCLRRWPWKWTVILIVTASLPLGYAAFTAATEPFIVKYGKVFSAMQFLFSSNRDHYVTGTSLLLRYAVFHMGLIALIALTQYPLWRQAIAVATKTMPRGTAKSARPNPRAR